MTSPFAETLDKAGAHPAPAPGGRASARDSAIRAKARRDLAETHEQRSTSTITAGHEMAFAWLRHDTNTPFGLVSCYVNGQPSALIVPAKPHADARQVEIMPLFVALTDGMRVTSPDGDVIYDRGEAA